MKKEFKEQCQAITMAGRLSDINEALQKAKENGTPLTGNHLAALMQAKNEAKRFVSLVELLQKEGGNHE